MRVPETEESVYKKWVGLWRGWAERGRSVTDSTEPRWVWELGGPSPGLPRGSRDGGGVSSLRGGVGGLVVSPLLPPPGASPRRTGRAGSGGRPGSGTGGDEAPLLGCPAGGPSLMTCWDTAPQSSGAQAPRLRPEWKGHGEAVTGLARSEGHTGRLGAPGFP